MQLALVALADRFHCFGSSDGSSEDCFASRVVKERTAFTSTAMA